MTDPTREEVVSYVGSLGCGAELTTMFRNRKVRLDLIPDEVLECPSLVIAKAASSLLLLGPSDAGKTTAAAWCAARLFSLDRERFRKVGTDRQWYLGHEIVQRIIDHGFDQLEKIKRRPLLVVDAWTESRWVIDGMIEYRSANQLPTIVTTHLEVDDRLDVTVTLKRGDG